MKKDLAISITSYNTKYHLEKCLKSIFTYTKNLSFEVIVTDNASTDGTVQMIKKKFPQVQLISNKVNKFFSKANNQAFEKSNSKYFLILNSDTYLTDNALKKLVTYMDRNPDVGASEGLEIYENGKLVPTGSKQTTPFIDFQELSLIGKLFQNKKLLSQFRLKNKNRKQTFEVDVACDAFLIVRSMLFKDIKMYDPLLKLYYTENDLCKKIQKKGYKIMHYGQSSVIHTVSASADKLGWKKNDIYYEDLKNYYKKQNYYYQSIILYMILKIEQKLLQIRYSLYKQN